MTHSTASAPPSSAPPSSILRHADVTDCVRDLTDGAGVRITGFHKIIERRQHALFGGGIVRVMRNCLPDDPELEIVSTYAICGRFHRPWHLEWTRPVPWPAEHIEEERRHHRDGVANPDDAVALKSTGYESLFAAFPPLTNHEHMLIAAWRRDTDDRIRAYEGSFSAPQVALELKEALL